MMDYKINVTFAEIVVSKNRRFAFKGGDDPSVKFPRIIISEPPGRVFKSIPRAPLDAQDEPGQSCISECA